jgi:iron complex outermembrane receptor protein
MKYLISTTLLGLSLFPLNAESVSTNETTQLKSVVIYASRIDEEKDSIPAAVDIFSIDDIENSGAANFTAFLQKKGNIFIRTMNSNPMQSQISMRGFGENSYGRVKIVVDGEELNEVDMSSPLISTIPLESIERVEILHGPSPILYGDGAVGGVINVETSTDDYEKKTRLSASAGSQYTFGANLMTKGGVEEDGIVYNASYDYLRSDGFRERSGYELHSPNAMIGKNFDNGSMFRLKVNYRNAFYEMPGALNYLNWKDSRKKAAYKNDWARIFSYGIAFDSKIVLSDNQTLFFDAVFSRKYRKSNWGDYGYFNEYNLYEFFLSGRYVNENDLFGFGNKFTFGSDLRYDLYRTKDNSGALDKKPYFDRLRSAVFLQDEFFFTDELSFILGSRIENIDNRWAKTSAVKNHNINDWTVSWEAGLVYRPIEDMRTWIKSSRFFRSPFCDELSYTENGEALDPENGYSFDIGGEYKFAKEFTFNIDGYAMFIEDEIFYNPYAKYYGSYWGGYNCNSPSTTQRFGLDTGLSWKRENVAEASIKYSLVKAEFRSGQFSDNDIPMVPNHHLRLECGYWLTPELEVKCAYRYVGPQRFASDFNNEHGKLPGYSLFDAGIIYSPSWAEGWKASAVIDNIFDREYCDFAGWSDYSGAYCYPACGRSFMFTVSCEF